MWCLLILLLIAHDFFKYPIDTLYFRNPLRPLIGIRNTLIDIVYWGSAVPDLWMLKVYHKKIVDEYKKISKTLKKNYFHDLDPWFEKNQNYYFYKVKDFPVLKSLINQIPSIYKETALFAVMDGPITIPPHRAETNLLLRYHLTIEGGDDCTLYTETGKHIHKNGEDFIFDHAKYHEVVKTGWDTRVVLILDVYR